MPKVLIVEDDAAMSAALSDGFKYEGYDVELVRDGASALEKARGGGCDLIILDIMLPKMSGLDVCRELRARGDSTPIIMLTARRQEIDKVVGLKMGADDYVTKPFGFMELLARVEALLRRASGRAAGGVKSHQFGDIVADFERGEVRKGGRRLELSSRELRLLQIFVQHRSEVVSRERLLEEVWDYAGAPLTRTVDMHVAKLRKKIEDNPADPRHILTVHGVGYKFVG